MTARAVQYQAEAGLVHRIYRGVYSIVPAELLSGEGRYMAAVLACAPGAVLSHASAASLLELRRSDSAKIDITVPRRSSRGHDGIRVHRSTTLTVADATRINGIPCMTVARTVLDLADVLQRRPTERVFDQAEIAGVLDLNQLNDQLARNPSRPGGKVIRAILDEHYIGSTSTMNDFEEAFLRLTRTLKLPDPEVNTFIVLDDGEPAIQADFVWRAQRVVVETDGRRTHGTRQAFESDRRRDQRLTAAGWRVIRTTWRQLTRRPEELARVLLRVVGSA